MEIGLYVAAAALIFLTALMFRGLSAAARLAEKFALLDRDGNLPLLRRLMLASSVLALGCAALMLALAFLGTFGGEAPRTEVTPEPTEEWPIPEAQLESMYLGQAKEQEAVPTGSTDPELEIEAESEVQAEAEAETEVAEQVAEPPKPVAPIYGGWRETRIVSAGGVTLRAWPNGSALRLLAPDEVVMTRGELREAGGFVWEKLKLADGQTGWVVGRFVGAP